MPRLFHQPPKYGLHKPSKQAVVYFQGRAIYLGPHGSEKSHQRYREFLDEWNKLRHRDAPSKKKDSPEERLAAAINPTTLRKK